MKPNGEAAGVRLRRRRVAMDISQRQLAAEVGCSNQHIHRIELEGFVPSRELMKKIARSLLVKVWDIWPEVRGEEEIGG